MDRVRKLRINRKVAVLSLVAGAVIWFLSRGFYSAWNRSFPDF